MDTPFLNTIAEGLANEGICVARFEFPYMVQRRKTGKKRPPDREPKLRESWHDVIRQLGAEGLIIGGKSMGGRIASMIADEANVKGLVCLGYPFHPVGKPDRLRIDHLQSIRTPTLIIQGTRDPFGTREEVEGYELAKTVQLHWLQDGNHDFRPRKASGCTEEQHLEAAIEVIVGFVKSL